MFQVPITIKAYQAHCRQAVFIPQQITMVSHQRPSGWKAHLSNGVATPICLLSQHPLRSCWNCQPAFGCWPTHPTIGNKNTPPRRAIPQQDKRRHIKHTQLSGCHILTESG